jgi:hypothetical protein
VKVELLHNQLSLQAFAEVISIFKPINYLYQLLSLSLLIISIDCLNNIIVVFGSLCEEGLKQEIV